MVVEHLLGDAPPHIRQPQIRELSELPLSLLELLFAIRQAPDEFKHQARKQHEET